MGVCPTFILFVFNIEGKLGEYLLKICFVLDMVIYFVMNLKGLLTPPEVANLADRASRGRDPAMVKAAGELALSSLPHAHNLNPNEISRALIQVGF